MKKFAVFSGFLGSGKTTAMIAITKYISAHFKKAAMISNDLGPQALADHRLALFSGCSALQITGDCICYQTEHLVNCLDSLFEQNDCSFVISDIPGFGVGALEHVYHTLNTQFHDRYELAPFTVIVEPYTLWQLQSGLSKDLEYIIHSQLMEADLIVLNKCDLISSRTKDELLSFLASGYPHASALSISALTGEGLDVLSRTLLSRCASMRLPDIGYGKTSFCEAMEKMSEFYIQYYAAVCCNTFDGNAYLNDLANAIQEELKNTRWNIPHLKLLAWQPEGDYAKADLLGSGRPIEQSKLFSGPCTELAVMLNASAVCPEKDLEALMRKSIENVSEAYHLTLVVYKKDCFGMGD